MNTKSDSMAAAAPKAAAESAVESGRTVLATRPADGGTLTVPSSPGGQVNLDFEPSAATATREGNSLMFDFGAEGKVVLQDFFVVGDESLPNLRLPDGTVVASAKFFENSDLDLSTAAGPAQAQAPGSGGTSYADGSGSLVEGVDRLGDQGTDYWGRNTNAPEIPPLTLAAVAGDSATPGTPNTPGNPSTPVTPVTPVTPPAPGGDTGENKPHIPPGQDFARPQPDIRVVLYNPGDPAGPLAAEPVTADIFFPQANGAFSKLTDASQINFNGENPGALYSVTTSLPDGWSDSWVRVIFNDATGRMEFRLTEEGMAEMKNLGLPENGGKDLVDFIQVTVSNTATGEHSSYTVEFVGTDDPSFNSAAHDALYSSSPRIGEYHQGNNNTWTTEYDIQASSKNDEIIINDMIEGNTSIHASGQPTSSVNPTAGLEDYNTIILNKGIEVSRYCDTVTITSADGSLYSDSIRTDNGRVIVDMGKGDITVNGALGQGWNFEEGAGSGLFAFNNGTNELSGKNITVTGVVDGMLGGITSDDPQKGTHILTATGGDVTITGTAGHGIWSGANSITATEVNGLGGAITITGGKGSGISGAYETDITGKSVNISGSTYGMSSGTGTHTVTATDDDISIAGGTMAGLEAYKGVNTITAEKGNVDIVGGEYGVSAIRSGQNEIAGQNVKIASSEIAGNAPGVAMNASGDNSLNRVTADDTVTIIGKEYGVKASEGGANTISGDAVEIATVIVDPFPTGFNGYFYSLPDFSSSIEIRDGEYIVKGSYAGGLDALKAMLGGESKLELYLDTGAGLRSWDISFSLTDQNLRIEGDSFILPTGATPEEGLLVSCDMSYSENIDIPSSFGLRAEADGTNTVEALGAVSIKGTTHGVQASDGGANTITGAEVEINSKQDALLAEKNGTNTVAASGTVSIESSSLSAVEASEGGQNEITGQNVKIASSGITGYDPAVAMNASGDNSLNRVTADDTVTIIGKQYGLKASEGGANAISGDTVEISTAIVDPFPAEFNGFFSSLPGFSHTIEIRDGEYIVKGTYAGGLDALKALLGGESNLQLSLDTGEGWRIWDIPFSLTDQNLRIEGDSFIMPTGVTPEEGHLFGGVMSYSENIYIPSSFGLRAEADGTNTVEALGAVSIKGTTYGVQASDGGANTITGAEVEINSKQDALLAENNGTNTVAASGTVSIESSYLRAVEASGSGENIISGKNVDINGKVADYDYVLKATTDGKNFVTAEEAVHIVGGAYATGEDSENTLKGKIVDIACTGLLAEMDGKNTVEADERINICTNDRALKVVLNGTNSLISKGDVNIETEYEYVSVLEAYNGENIVKADGEVTIHAKLREALYAGESGGVNNVSGETVNITGSNSALYAREGTNKVSGTDVILTSVNESPAAHNAGMSAWYGGDNIVTAIANENGEGGNVYISHTRVGGLFANYTGSKNTIAAEGSVSIVCGGGVTGESLNAMNGGVNDVSGKSVEISGGPNAGGHGMSAWGSGSLNRVTATDGYVNISRDNSAVYSTDNGENIISGNDVKITSTGYAATMAWDVGLNTVIATTGDVTISGHHASLHAYGSGSKNDIRAENGTIFIQNPGDSKAAGIEAHGGGENILTAHKVDITGMRNMMAISGGTNTINGVAIGEEGVTVTLTAKSGYAMWADGTGSANLINGTAKGDMVTINGSIETSNGGMNIISTGDGDDVIVLNGSVFDGCLTLDAGDGHDILTLKAANGAEFANRYGNWLNSLTEDTFKGIEEIRIEGIADLDELNSLGLNGFAAFISNSSSGINVSFPDTAAAEGMAAAFAAPMAGFGVEDDDSLSDLITPGNNPMAGPITAEGDYDVLRLDLLNPQGGEASDGSISLSGLGSLSDLSGNGLGSFDVLDITDDKDTVLDIDTLLSSFNENGKLLVRSEDSQDTVSLSREWTQQDAAVTENGVNYTSFTNDHGEELLIQQNIFILTSN